MGKLKILDENLNNPHKIFGMHLCEKNSKKELKTTIYCKGAQSLAIIPIDDDEKVYPLQETAEKDIFEGTIARRKKKFLYKVKAINEEGQVWEYIDPYQFESTIDTETEILYGKGKDYEIYHKLGAHPRKIKGIEGISFVVWAPNAKAVSVVGDFNFWDGRRHMMRLLEASGLWEIFIPGVLVGSCYKYEITTQDNTLLYKADPYASYGEQRPQTASKVWDDQSYVWNDSKWLQKRAKKEWHKEPVSIYELHIGSWKQHEDGRFYTYREMAQALSAYVKEMGYTHIEVMGIMEHPFDGSWGYQVTGYFAPTSRYGTPDDFKYFVDTMHKHHIGVILDWVPAHFPKDAFGLEKFDGTALYEHFNKQQAEHPEWGTLIFNYGRLEVRNFLIASALSWLDRYHIDALRVDAVASMLYLNYAREDEDYIRNQYGGCENLEAVEFLRRLNEEAYGRFKGIMMIAEESTAWKGVTRPTSEGGLGFGFKWNMGWMNDFLAYMKTDPLFRKYEHNKITFSLMYAFNENFILPLSHDEVVHGKSPMVYKMPGDSWKQFANLRLAYGYLFMHPGKKMLFMGNEFGQTREWSEQRALDWELLVNASHAGVQQFVKDLNHLYRKQKSLWELDHEYLGFEWIDCDNKDESIVSFIRKAKNSKNQLIVVVNFTPEVRRDFRIGVNYLGRYKEILNSDATCYDGSGVVNDYVDAKPIASGHFKGSIEITVPPLGIVIFKCQNPKNIK